MHAVRRSLEDGQRTTAGQLHRTAFLNALRDSLVQACDAELKPVGRSAQGCPYILRSIEYYATRPLSSLLRLIQVFGRPPAGADAAGLIRAVTRGPVGLPQSCLSRSRQRVHAKTAPETAALKPHDPVSLREQLGDGRQLDSPVRTQMERSFGTGFGSVRVHTDATAARLSTELGARAFTIGSDIAFANGLYRPSSASGSALLAHELAHTLQQDDRTPISSNRAGDMALEEQADQAALGVLSGRVDITSGLGGIRSGVHVQRDPVTDVALAALLLTAEVGTDVAVTDTAVVLVSDAAAPVLVDTVAAEVPAAVGTLATEAPAAIGTLAPAATTAATTAATSSGFSTAAAIGTGLAATTLSSDQDDEQPCDLPTGLNEFDPIPMTWFKVWTPDYYPTPIEIGGHYYDRDDSTQHLPHGEPIGVDEAYRPHVGKTVQLDPEERGPQADRYRAVLARHGFDWRGLQADHVQDLQWSGADDFNNLWPLDASANLSAGARPDHEGRSKQCNPATNENSRILCRWFVISNFSR